LGSAVSVSALYKSFTTSMQVTLIPNAVITPSFIVIEGLLKIVLIAATYGTFGIPVFL
jgi:hypothetical protein